MAFSRYSVRNTFIQLDDTSDDDVAPLKRSLTWDGALSWESQSDHYCEADTESILSDDVALDDKSIGGSTDVPSKDDGDLSQSSEAETDACIQGKPFDDQQYYMPEHPQNPHGMVAVQCVVAQPFYYVLQNLEDCPLLFTHACAVGVYDMTDSKGTEATPVKKGLSGAQRRKVKKEAARLNRGSTVCEAVQN